MQVVTWNVNSLRARHARVSAWLEQHRPDVVHLQETKCSDADFGVLAHDYRRLGYEHAHHGDGPNSGVAILSRTGLDDVERGFPGVDLAPFTEPRLLTASCGGIRHYCVYAPSGRQFKHRQWYFKLDWLRLLDATIDVDEPAIAAGDFNVQPAPIDVYDPAAWKRRNHGSQQERDAIAKLIDSGLRDVTREYLTEPGVFTWWSHLKGQFEKNRGMRIDLALCTDPIADRVTSVWIDLAERAQPDTSDHAPLVIEIASPSES